MDGTFLTKFSRAITVYQDRHTTGSEFTSHMVINSNLSEHRKASCTALPNARPRMEMAVG